MTHILEISLTHFRNIESAKLRFSPSVNFIFGENGAGKSSLLEAVHCISMGKSFRSTEYLPLIQHSSTAFNLYTSIVNNERVYGLGLSRNQAGGREARVDGNKASSVAALAAHLPTILLSSFSYLFYSGGPRVRRQFLDWLTFHVKHEFYAAWRDFQGLLKQRNKALKQRLPFQEVSAWDVELALQAEKIHAARQEVFDKLHPVFAKHIAMVLPARQTKLEYSQGWGESLTLGDQLKANLLRDYQLGYTELGPQRADMRMWVDGCDASDILSQGQQKVAVFALQLAIGETLFQDTGKKAVFLLDDLASELDVMNRQRIVSELMTMQAQLIVTGIEFEELRSVIQNSQAKVFHVKQGKIEEFRLEAEPAFF